MSFDDDDVLGAPVRRRKDLLAMGDTDRSIAAALRSGELARPRRGAYVDGDVWRRATPVQRYALRCKAAYAQADTSVFLSHVAALPFLEAPTWGLSLDLVHLTRTDNRAGRKEAGIQQHRGTVLAGDVVASHGVRHSSAVRAALEATLSSEVVGGLAVVNMLLHRGDVTAATLRERYERRMEHWPDSLRTDLVLRLADPRIESVGETRTFHLFWREGLPLPVPQYEVRDARDRLVARLDFAWPELGIWVEFDGRVKYAKHLREGESPADAVFREKRREELVAELTGWRCVRLSWDDLADPREVVRRFQAALAAVRSARTPTH